MAQELLSPEEEQQQQEPSKTRFLDAVRDQTPITPAPHTPDKDAKPITPAEQAQLDQLEASLRDGETAKEPKPKATEKVQQAQKAASFMAKNKKWFIGGGAGLGLLIPIAAFFFWMMLFKNVHIKNLYVTYRWAQFNRGLNKAVKAQLEYAKANPEAAKPSGAAEGTVNPADAPDKISAETNKDAGPDTIDPDDPSKIEAESKKVSSLEQSVEGVSEKALTDAGATRNIAAAEGTGDTPEAKAKSAEEKAKANIEEELAKNKLENGPPDSISDGVDEAKQLEEAGKSSREAALQGADRILNGSGWKTAARQAAGIFNIVTFYCIFHDIYASAKDEITKIAMNGAMATSQLVNKTADCQKTGDCDATQIGAVANKFDNDEESFSDSCGYGRATQQNTSDCQEIDPNFVVNGLVSVAGDNGTAKTAILTADALLDPPFELTVGPVKVGMDEACSVVNSSITQFGFAALNIGLIASSGGGWGAASKAAGQGAIVFAGTAGGKALIASAIMRYSDNLYKDLSPVDMGNLTDMGNMATASASCIAGYCPLATGEQLGQLDREYRQERIAANSKRSILEKLFDTGSPDSVTSRVVLNAPATPAAVVGRIKNIFATISSPSRISKSLGNNTLAITRSNTAYAEGENDTGASVYGLKNVAIPANLFADSSSYESVVQWGKGRDLSALESELKSCAGKDADAYSKIIGDDNQKCLWNNLSADQKMYMQYKYHQNVAYKRALVNNNQSNLPDSVGGAVGSGSGSGSTEGADRGIDTSDPAKFPCPAGTARSVTTSQTSQDRATTYKIGLCDIGGGMVVNASAAQAYLDMKIAAAADGITLTGSGHRDFQRQIELRIAHGCGGVKIFSRDCKGSPPTAVPGRSMHEAGLAVDFQNSRTRGTAVYQWLAANASRFGIKNLPSEPWHWSVNGS